MWTNEFSWQNISLSYDHLTFPLEAVSVLDSSVKDKRQLHRKEEMKQSL